MTEQRNPFEMMTEADIIGRVLHRYDLKTAVEIRMYVRYAERGVLCKSSAWEIVSRYSVSLGQLLAGSGGEVVIPFGDLGLAGIRPVSVLLDESGLRRALSPIIHPSQVSLYVPEARQSALLKYWTTLVE